MRASERDLMATACSLPRGTSTLMTELMLNYGKWLLDSIIYVKISFQWQKLLNFLGTAILDFVTSIGCSYSACMKKGLCHNGDTYSLNKPVPLEFRIKLEFGLNGSTHSETFQYKDKYQQQSEPNIQCCLWELNSGTLAEPLHHPFSPSHKKNIPGIC